nr:hypothetical protein [Tanacetum cinerariifolium]
AATQVVAASTHIPAAKPKTLTITAAPAVSIRRRKGVVIRDHEEDLPSDTLAETPKCHGLNLYRITSLTFLIVRQLLVEGSLDL